MLFGWIGDNRRQSGPDVNITCKFWMKILLFSKIKHILTYLLTYLLTTTVIGTDVPESTAFLMTVGIPWPVYEN